MFCCCCCGDSCQISLGAKATSLLACPAPAASASASSALRLCLAQLSFPFEILFCFALSLSSPLFSLPLLLCLFVSFLVPPPFHSSPFCKCRQPFVSLRSFCIIFFLCATLLPSALPVAASASPQLNLHVLWRKSFPCFSSLLGDFSWPGLGLARSRQVWRASGQRTQKKGRKKNRKRLHSFFAFFFSTWPKLIDLLACVEFNRLPLQLLNQFAAAFLLQGKFKFKFNFPATFSCAHFLRN